MSSAKASRLAVILLLLLGGCSNTIETLSKGDFANLDEAIGTDTKKNTEAIKNNEYTGALLGGGAGLVIASGLGGGKYKLLELVGAGIVGAFIGNYAQSRLKGDEPQALAARQADVLVNGSDNKAVAWQGESSQTTAKITATDTRREQKDLTIARDKQVKQPDKLSILGNSWQVKTATSLRSAPNRASDELGTLKPGEIIQVMGSVAGGAWLLVQRDGVAVGYVEASRAQTAPPGAQAPAVVREGPIDLDELDDVETVTETTKVSTTCRTVTTEIAGGVDSLDSCKAADGAWEL